MKTQDDELRKEFKHLINIELPGKYNEPVRYNHCFNRIILDWLFNDCWYDHLVKNKTAISQLTERQLKSAIKRMKLWLQDKQILVDDNDASLLYRKNKKMRTGG